MATVATIKIDTRRVTLAELDRLRAEDAARPGISYPAGVSSLVPEPSSSDDFIPLSVTFIPAEQLDSAQDARPRVALPLLPDSAVAKSVLHGVLLDPAGLPVPEMPTAVAPSEECSAPALPLGPCPVCPRLAAQFEPYRQAAYWKSMHEKAKDRERLLQQENQQLHARVRYLQQQLFGRKSDSPSASTSTGADASQTPTTTTTPAKRPRGQQRGKPGPPRRDYSHLPFVEEFHDLDDDKKGCPHCGLPFEPFPGTEDSTVVEIDVRAHRRVIRRRRYKPGCVCPDNPGIITAPGPAKLIPKGIFGISVWVEVLLDKYLFYRPTYRLLADLQTHDLGLSQGSLTSALQRLVPLFAPVYEKLGEHSQKQTLWHADETRWLVFVTCEGKVGYRWYLWVFHAEEVVYFILAMGRAHDVPEKHLGPVESGIMVVDRYKAYPAIDKVKAGLIILAFCWAHQRRDFLDVARSWPQLEGWGLAWVQRIGELYQLNDKRVEVLEQPEAFKQADKEVREKVKEMQEQAQKELEQAEVHPAKKHVLESMGNHWTGLTVFVEHPEVPMDNNTAERAHRGPVVGRKNYYGSGALWSGQLAAMLFSLFQTLALWNINPRKWLTEYLQACAAAGGQAPADVGSFMPWNMPEEKRKEWALEKEKEREDSS
jgi:transposase